MKSVRHNWHPFKKRLGYRHRRRQWHPTPVLLPGKSHGRRSLEGCNPWGRWESDMTERLHFHFHALEKEMATHSRVLALRVPGTGEPGGLPSMGSHRVGHDWRDLVAAAARYRHTQREEGRREQASEENNLQTKERAIYKLRRKASEKPCSHLDLGFLTSNIIRKSIPV